MSPNYVIVFFSVSLILSSLTFTEEWKITGASPRIILKYEVGTFVKTNINTDL